jgi:hypothetical protein
MSKDYPNRQVWLAVRKREKQPRKYSHVSAALKMVMDSAGKSFYWEVIPKSQRETFNVGRNQEKRTAKRMDMLANRRLRQRQLAA